MVFRIMYSNHITLKKLIQGRTDKAQLIFRLRFPSLYTDQTALLFSQSSSPFFSHIHYSFSLNGLGSDTHGSGPEV